MSKSEANMLELENELTSVETDATEEEKYNAEVNYGFLESEIKRCRAEMPYPDVKKYTVGIDYEERSALQYKKRENKPFYDDLELLDAYYNHNNGELYKGHVSIGDKDYYIMDSGTLASKPLGASGRAMLINSDDERYLSAVKAWREPSTNKAVAFSRNIRMKNRSVYDTDVVFDRGSTVFSHITDAYLRKALLRNRADPLMQSIIQTIQKNQDEIRLLPKKATFAVQGCAGSGKTMVLLHRIRYLLYNRYIKNGEYVFLVPSRSFKNFIKPLLSQFNINSQAVIPYQSYYKAILGKSSSEPGDEASELVFDANFLARVYSEDFMRECYGELLRAFDFQTNELIAFFEQRLNEIVEYEQLLIDEEMSRLRNELCTWSKNIIEPISEHLPPIEDAEDVAPVIEKLSAVYSAAKEEHDKAAAPDPQITISPDDVRIAGDPQLTEMKKQIKAEEEQLKRSSVFTAASHRMKLTALNEKYKEVYAAVEARLIEEDAAAAAAKAADSAFVYDGVSLSEVDNMLAQLMFAHGMISEKLADEQKKKENLNDQLLEKYGDVITTLNQLVEQSARNISTSAEQVLALEPAHSSLGLTVQLAHSLTDGFAQRLSDPEKDELQKFKFFSGKTAAQFEAYMNARLLNICRKKLRDEFGIKICKLYKHYWYIELYCQYLTRNIKRRRFSYLFMDEAQDLSRSELELIIKLNREVEEGSEQVTAHDPVVNMFGDVNQMITDHGLKSWDAVGLKHKSFALNENFRNPDKIVEYCNEKLSLSMQKVAGDDTEAVFEYTALENAMFWCKSMFDSPVFIVKDEYARKDLAAELAGANVENYTIYTVPEVKGLEFKEVFVLDRGMTDNERYVSYTRPLQRLNIIKTLPHLCSTDEALFEQGESVEDDIDA